MTYDNLKRIDDNSPDFLRISERDSNPALEKAESLYRENPIAPPTAEPIYRNEDSDNPTVHSLDELPEVIIPPLTVPEGGDYEQKPISDPDAEVKVFPDQTGLLLAFAFGEMEQEAEERYWPSAKVLLRNKLNAIDDYFINQTASKQPTHHNRLVKNILQVVAPREDNQVQISNEVAYRGERRINNFVSWYLDLYDHFNEQGVWTEKKAEFKVEQAALAEYSFLLQIRSMFLSVQQLRLKQGQDAHSITLPIMKDNYTRTELSEYTSLRNFIEAYDPNHEFSEVQDDRLLLHLDHSTMKHMLNLFEVTIYKLRDALPQHVDTIKKAKVKS